MRLLCPGPAAEDFIHADKRERLESIGKNRGVIRTEVMFGGEFLNRLVSCFFGSFMSICERSYSIIVYQVNRISNLTCFESHINWLSIFLLVVNETQ